MLVYCRGLNEFSKPDYDVIRKKFKALYFAHYDKWDCVWDWSYVQVSLSEHSIGITKVLYRYVLSLA